MVISSTSFVNLNPNNILIKPIKKPKDLFVVQNRFNFQDKTIKNPDNGIFFIRMEVYEKDELWEKKMIKLRDKTASLIKKDKDFSEILYNVELGVHEINSRYHGYGVRRKQDERSYRIAPYGRGKEYFESYKQKYKMGFQPSATEEYKDADTIKLLKNPTFCDSINITQNTKNYSCKNIDLIRKEYEKLKAIENPTVDEINKSCATIQWLFYQGFVYINGTDSIANMLTKSIYKAYGIQVSPAKEGVSFDFEAFGSNLDDYIKNYPDFFEKRPYKIEKKAKKNMISAISNRIYINSPSFAANKKQIKPVSNDTNKTKEVEYDVFFINMHHYDKNQTWAQQMVNLSKEASKLINEDKDFDEIIETIEKGVNKINGTPIKQGFGERRDYDRRSFRLTKNGRGGEYFDKYLEKTIQNFQPASNEEYKNADIVKIRKSTCFEDSIHIIQDTKNYSCINLELSKKEYEKLKSIENPTVDEINKSCATIQWLISQGICYRHGTDSIANVLTKAIYKAYGIEISPYKKGISADFEAFGTNLDDYIKKYPTFFKKPPHKLTKGGEKC